MLGTFKTIAFSNASRASKVSCTRNASTTTSRNILGRPVLSIPTILDNYEAYTETIVRKNLSPKLGENLAFIKDNYSKTIEMAAKATELKRQREKYEQKMKRKEPIEREQLLEVKKQFQEITRHRNELLDEIEKRAESLPQIVHESVPMGSEPELVELINCKSIEETETESMTSNFPSHKVIGKDLGILEMDSASRVCGHSFYYFVGDGMLLEQALIQYGLSLARKAGYIPLATPSLIREEVIGACGFQPRDKGQEKQIYTLEDEDLVLSGTAEIPIAALHSKRIFNETESKKFPLRYVGLSRAFRAEAGARGIAVSGIYRVHEFNKLELFHFTTIENAYKELEEIRLFQTEFVRSLGLKARVLNMPANDLGAPAAKKYDIEAWMPGRKDWGELTSTSVCGDFQARRLNIRYRDAKSGSLKHLTTLNGTAVAIPRVIVAIIENNYDPKTQSIEIPQVLRPFMGGQERITKNELLL